MIPYMVPKYDFLGLSIIYAERWNCRNNNDVTKVYSMSDPCKHTCVFRKGMLEVEWCCINAFLD